MIVWATKCLDQKIYTMLNFSEIIHTPNIS